MEATLALLYRRIAAHIRSLGAAHTPIAEEFDRLVADELQHQATILRAVEQHRGGSAWTDRA